MRADAHSGPTPDFEVTTHSAEETGVLGRLLGELVRPDDVIALTGALGAGKTCLVQGIARGLDILEPVPSPTFNLLLVHAGRFPLYHFDLYRLDRADQLEDIDFFATLEAGGVSIIEWADKFDSELPDERLDVSMETVGETARRMDMTARGARAAGLAAQLGHAWAIVAGGAGGRD